MMLKLVATCAIFGSATAQLPAGYAGDNTATTVTGLGISCAAGFSGDPTATCAGTDATTPSFIVGGCTARVACNTMAAADCGAGKKLDVSAAPVCDYAATTAGSCSDTTSTDQTTCEAAVCATPTCAGALCSWTAPTYTGCPEGCADTQAATGCTGTATAPSAKLCAGSACGAGDAGTCCTENTCTTLSVPAGYAATDATATTVSGLGALSCASTHTGTLPLCIAPAWGASIRAEYNDPKNGVCLFNPNWDCRAYDNCLNYRNMYGSNIYWVGGLPPVTSCPTDGGDFTVPTGCQM